MLSTPWQTLDACPRNGRQPDPTPVCEALVFPEFVPGLRNLEGFSHLILLYWLHHGPHGAGAPEMTVTPPFDREPHGLFTTRSPRRPNPIGLSVVAFDGFAAPDRLQGALSGLHGRDTAAGHQALFAVDRRRAKCDDGMAGEAPDAATARRAVVMVSLNAACPSGAFTIPSTNWRHARHGHLQATFPVSRVPATMLVCAA